MYIFIVKWSFAWTAFLFLETFYLSIFFLGYLLDLTVAWYITLACRQLPFSGHSYFVLQVLFVVYWCFFPIVFFHYLQHVLSVVEVKILFPIFCAWFWELFVHKFEYFIYIFMCVFDFIEFCFSCWIICSWWIVGFVWLCWVFIWSSSSFDFLIWWFLCFEEVESYI